MQYSQFSKALRRMNSKLVFRPGRNRASGLYLKKDGFEGSDERTGLLHLFGVPSPRLFFTLPRHNFYDEFGNWHRGLKTVCRLLVDNHVVSYRAVKKEFGDWVFMGKLGEPFNTVTQNNKRKEALDRLMKEAQSYRTIYSSAVA